MFVAGNVKLSFMRKTSNMSKTLHKLQFIGLFTIIWCALVVNYWHRLLKFLPIGEGNRPSANMAFSTSRVFSRF